LLWKSSDTDAVYTPALLKELVSYAAERGVRIVPEFDVPGHGGWNYGALPFPQPPLPLATRPAQGHGWNYGALLFPHA
jgi:N-acetyl-beta-hexosaminidase